MEATQENGASVDPKTKTILIVEDDEELLDLLQLAVQREGFNFLLAKSGDQALQRLDRKPDAVLLDLMLPGLTNGIEVLRYVRSLTQPPPVIVLTAYGTRPEFMEASQDLNVIESFHKPIAPDELMAAMHRVLKTRPPKR